MTEGAAVAHAVGLLRHPPNTGDTAALNLAFYGLKLPAEEGEECGFSATRRACQGRCCSLGEAEVEVTKEPRASCEVVPQVCRGDLHRRR